MWAKINFELKLANHEFVNVELWDNDLFLDDKLKSLTITKSGKYEMLFDTNSSGELRPELYILIFSMSGELIFRSKIYDNISSLAQDEITGFNETKTIDIGLIELI
jgi:hypothetical protein